MRKLFLASACLSSEGAIKCVHQDGDWVQLEHLISLIRCELFGGVVIRKGSKLRPLTVMGWRVLRWLQQPALPRSDGNCLVLFTCIDRWGACAFLLPLFFYSLERRGCSEVGSLPLIKTHRTYISTYIHIFLDPNVTGAYDLSCDTGTTKLSSFTLRSVLLHCSWPKLTDCTENKQKGSCGSGVTNLVRWEPSARVNVDVGEGLTLPFCFPCPD